MNTSGRYQRLVDLVAESRALLSTSPVSCRLLRLLDALSDQETKELGTRHLNKDRHSPILERLSQTLEIDSRIVWSILAHSMAWDLEDYAPRYAAARQAYEAASLSDVDIRQLFRPNTVSFMYHSQLGSWSATDEVRAVGMGLVYLLDHDGRRIAICEGYLVAASRAFPTTIALLRASMEQDWRGWQSLWQHYF